MSDPVVRLIVCGAPLTARAPDIVEALIKSGYDVQVVATPTARGWLDAAAVARLTGRPPRSEYRAPAEPKDTLPAAVTVVCPATFNTVNKAAIGASDTYALGVLCESMGSGLPLLVAPMVNDDLWRHPAWASSLGVFERAGARFLDVRTGERRAVPVESGSGPDIVARFDPRWLVDLVKAVLHP